MLKTPAQGADVDNPSAVKVVTQYIGVLSIFRESTIPHDRKSGECSITSTLVSYGYRKDALDRFVKWPESKLEKE